MSRVKDIFDKIERKIFEKKGELSDTKALIQFNISGPEGGNWVIDLKDESMGVREGDEDANCTFSATDVNFLKLINKEIKPEMAIMTGKLKLSGDVMLAMKLANLFKR